MVGYTDKTDTNFKIAYLESHHCVSWRGKMPRLRDWSRFLLVDSKLSSLPDLSKFVSSLNL